MNEPITSENPSVISNDEIRFPSNEEISQFQKLSNLESVSDPNRIIGLWKKFRKGSNSKNGKILKEIFVNLIKSHFNLKTDTIPLALFRRFGIRKYIDRGQTEVLDNKIDLHDIILALTLLSRIPDEEKILLVFKLTDVDEDGCLSPDEIFKMIEVIGRIFAKENTDITLASKVLLEELSREKSIRIYDWAMRSVGNLELKCHNENGLVAFDDFNNVLENMPELRRQFLPRYIDFRAVLRNVLTEPILMVSESKRDDFLMFRYEMQALFADATESKRKKHWREQTEIEENAERANMEKSMRRNIQDFTHKECPGLVKTENEIDTDIPAAVWEFNSLSNRLYVRDTDGGVDSKPIDRKTAIPKIIPPKPVTKALIELKKNMKPEHVRNNEDDVANSDAFLNKVNNQVREIEDRAKKLHDYPTLLPTTFK